MMSLVRKQFANYISNLFPEVSQVSAWNAYRLEMNGLARNHDPAQGAIRSLVVDKGISGVDPEVEYTKWVAYRDEGKKVMNMVKTPSELNIKKGTYIGPEGGWKPETYYYVDASFSSNNPFHTYIFYSGFLSAEGFPQGYNCILSPTVEGKPSINDLYCLKVVAPIPAALPWSMQ